MTVETDDCTGVVVVASEVECQGNNDLNLTSSCEEMDLSKVDGDCNGVVEQEDIKDDDADTDGSYVFVDGPDMVVSSSSLDPSGKRVLDTEDHVVVDDHTKGGEPIVEENIISKLENAGCLVVEESVQVNELSVGEEGRLNSYKFREFGEESVVISSTRHNLAALEASSKDCMSNNAFDEEVVEEQSDAVVDQNKLEANQESVVTSSERELQKLHNQEDEETTLVEEKKLETAGENMESHIVVTEAIESEPQREEEEETTKAADENSVGEHSSCIDGDAVDSNPNHLDSGEANDGKEKNLDSAEDAGQKNQESQLTDTGVDELELHEIGMEKQSFFGSVLKVGEDHDTQILGGESVVNGEEKETEKEALKEKSSTQHVGKERDLNIEAASSLDKDSLLDKEAKDVGEKDQDAEILVTKSIEPELHQLVNADKKETRKEPSMEYLSAPVDKQLYKEEPEDVGEDQDAQFLGTESVESESHQIVVGVSAQRDMNVEVTICSADDFQLGKESEDVNEEKDQDTQNMGTQIVESESQQLVNEDEKETEKEVSVEEPSAHVGGRRDLNLDTVCPADDSHLEKEATNGTEESVPSVPVQCAAVEPKVIYNSAEGQETMCTSPIDNAKLESDYLNGSFENSNVTDGLRSEKDVGDISVISEDSSPAARADCGGTKSGIGNSFDVYRTVPFCSADDSRSETEDAKSSETIHSCSPNETSAVTEVGNCSTERGQILATCSVENVKLEAEICESSSKSNHNISSSTILFGDASIQSEAKEACADKDIQNGDNAELEFVVENVSAFNSADMTNGTNDVLDAEHVGDGYIRGESGGKAICAEDEGTDTIGTQPFSTDDNTNDALEGQKVNEEVGKRPFRFLIRIPRYVDEKIKDEIRLAQLHVDEKTESRDSIRASIQSERAICSEYRDKFEAARSEERAAWNSLNAKRQEIDSVQLVFNRMKNATSIDEIDDRINNMEHMIEHETMPLKEEKQLIRDIKQLKNLRDQLSSTLGRQTEEQPTLDQKDKIEERFKLLKRELESARKEVLRREGITKAAKKVYYDESDKLKELQSQFRSADDLRQQAYIRLQNLKKQLYEKNKYFRMYKEDEKKAEDLAFAGDKEELQLLCVGQVEKIMELWNTNDDFRNEYMRCNTVSTLRRLRTLDGRSLGPDEEPPVLRNFVDVKVDSTVKAASTLKTGSRLPVTTLEQGSLVEKAEVKPLVNLEQKNQKSDGKQVLVNSDRNPAPAARANSKKISKPAGCLETGSLTIFGEQGVETEENKQREEKEEKERARKAEELRKEKEEAAAKLKEQRRLEEKAKAKEAEERKRRNAEKAQVKAELRAKREAEFKEKEREKRARKKERKVAVAVAAAAIEGENGGIGSAPSSEKTTQPEANSNDTQEQAETKEKSVAVVSKRKGAQKPLVQTKVKALPPNLRNRSKRRMQPWIWVLLTALVIVGLFLVGNTGCSFKFGSSSFGF